MAEGCNLKYSLHDITIIILIIKCTFLIFILKISTTKHGKLEEELRKELQTYRERLHAFQEKSLGSSNTEDNGNYFWIN